MAERRTTDYGLCEDFAPATHPFYAFCLLFTHLQMRREALMSSDTLTIGVAVLLDLAGILGGGLVLACVFGVPFIAVPVAAPEIHVWQQADSTMRKPTPSGGRRQV